MSVDWTVIAAIVAAAFPGMCLILVGSRGLRRLPAAPVLLPPTPRPVIPGTTKAPPQPRRLRGRCPFRVKQT